MKQYSKEVYGFLELMGVKLQSLGLDEILHYYQKYVEAYKLPKEEREPIISMIENLEIIEGE